MTEITAENINKLITNDVSQFMKQVMKKKERSQKQKENDAKLKDRLKSYHEQKRQAKSQNVMSVYDNTTDVLAEIQEAKEIQDIALNHVNETLDELQKVKSKRGRPKKHQHPGPSETIAAAV
jgi:hypothetical protein